MPRKLAAEEKNSAAINTAAATMTVIAVSETPGSVLSGYQ
jgi:hypothetical protein